MVGRHDRRPRRRFSLIRFLCRLLAVIVLVPLVLVVSIVVAAPYLLAPTAEFTSPATPPAASPGETLARALGALEGAAEDPARSVTLEISEEDVDRMLLAAVTSERMEALRVLGARARLHPGAVELECALEPDFVLPAALEWLRPRQVGLRARLAPTLVGRWLDVRMERLALGRVPLPVGTVMWAVVRWGPQLPAGVVFDPRRAAVTVDLAERLKFGDPGARVVLDDLEIGEGTARVAGRLEPVPGSN